MSPGPLAGFRVATNAGGVAVPVACGGEVAGWEGPWAPRGLGLAEQEQGLPVRGQVARVLASASPCARGGSSRSPQVGAVAKTVGVQGVLTADRWSFISEVLNVLSRNMTL